MAELIDAFIAECLELRGYPDWPQRVQADLSHRLASDAFREEIVRETGPLPTQKIFIQSPQMTVFANRCASGLRSPPHDHATEAVVALIECVEQFKTYRIDGERCVETGLQRVVAPSVAILPADIVHAMWNEPTEGGLALRIYGNAHFTVGDRRLWDPTTLVQRPYDKDQLFAWARELTVAAQASRS